MASRQILLVTKFAELWGGNFDAKVEELDKHIGVIDTKEWINKATDVYKIESSQIFPLARFKNKSKYLEPFTFYQVNN